VGEGPFGPDYPGAILLNTIYRNDLAQFGDEDTIFQDAYISQASGIAESALVRGIEFLMGGSGTGVEAKAWFEQSVRKSSMINSLLQFFAVSYEHIYPNCMAPGATVITITTQFETVVSNLWGEVGRYPSGSTTEEYTINSRHMVAFKKFMGDNATPRSLDFHTNLADQEDMKRSLEFLSNTLRGMRKAMHENACTSELIGRLDQNMIGIYGVKNP
jgi:hypothetical protein